MSTTRAEDRAAAEASLRSGQAELAWGGHRLKLLPGKAVWLAERRMLLVADVHIGKALAFRRGGLPVPHGTTADSIGRLGRLLRDLAAESVVFLGDLMHSRDAHSAATLAALRRWRDEFADVAMTLVRGNHDDRAGDPPADLRIDCVDEPWVLGPPGGAGPTRHPALALRHHPRPLAGCQVLAGHVHPAVSLSGGRAHDRLRLPCFHFRDGVGVLPAFGGFTGLQPIRRAVGERIFAVADGAVLEVQHRRRVTCAADRDNRAACRHSNTSSSAPKR